MSDDRVSHGAITPMKTIITHALDKSFLLDTCILVFLVITISLHKIKCSWCTLEVPTFFLEKKTNDYIYVWLFSLYNIKKLRNYWSLIH